MKKVTIGDIVYYLTKQEGKSILFSMKEYNKARTRATKYSLELSDTKWWEFWK